MEKREPHKQITKEELRETVAIHSNLGVLMLAGGDINNLSESIEDVSIVAESVTFLGDKKELLVKAQGDLSKAFIEIKADDNTEIKTNSEEKFKAKYSLEYLKRMMSGTKLSETAKLSFNTDYPLKLDYKVIDKLSLSFILAPRVDND